MKPSRIVSAFVLSAVLAFPIASAFAQAQLSAPNGIAASPKVRQFLAEQTAKTSPVVTRNNGCCQVACCNIKKNVAASPKLQAMLVEKSSGLKCGNNGGSGFAVIASNAGCVKCCN